MKIRYISYLTIVLAAFLLASCHSIMDDEVCADQPSPSTTPVQIGFTLTTGDVSSRAITEDTEAGTERENSIDIEGGDFRILLFDTSAEGKYLTSLKVNRIMKESETTYRVEGELSEAYPAFKLVVLANWGAYADNWTSETTIADVCEATYSYSNSFNINNDLIPMYGVQTYNNVELRANLLTELPTDINLLRAMAKIEVKCSADGFKLSEVKLHRYNIQGYCAPTGVYGNTAEDWNYDDDNICNHKVHIPENSKSESTLDFTPTADGFIAYVPEFDNKTNPTERSYIEVTLRHSDESESEVILNSDPYIYFCKYNTETGKPVENASDFDIVRNHWYTYTINKVDDGKLIFQYRVKLWNVVESAIGWNPTYKEDFLLAAWNNETDDKNAAITDATKGDNEAIYCYVCNPGYEDGNNNSNHNTLKDGTSGAAFSFTLRVPKGATWKGYLTNNIDFYFSYGPYWNDSKHAVSTGIARTDEYQIKIQARHAWTEYEDGSVPSFDAPNTLDGDRFQSLQGKGGIYTDFYIMVSPDGNEFDEYMLKINPINAVDETKTNFKDGRRFAGPDDYHVRIWQLKATKGDGYDVLFNRSEDIKEFRK